ncbi:MAG: adenylate/guanylate cyclase domain-containing protein [Burkholderiales bacterium]
MLGQLKRHAFRIIIGLLAVLAVYLDATQPANQRYVSKIEDALYDYRINLARQRDKFESIVILDFDEKSLAKEGQWPWSRNKLAALLDQLFDHYGVAVLGFDVVFPEPDRSSGLEVLRGLGNKELKDIPQFQTSLSELSGQLDYNRLFATKLKSRAVVLGYSFQTEEDPGKAADAWKIPPPVFPAGTFENTAIPYVFKSYVANLAALQNNAASGGFFTIMPDEDGVMRRVPMLVQYKDEYYEPLSLAVMRNMLGKPKLIPHFSNKLAKNFGEGRIEALEIEGGLRIPVDERLSALIPYRGKEGSFPYYSIVDALNGRLAKSDLENKIVLVGTRTEGLRDLRSTPMGPTYPGVEIHANMIAGMMEGKIWQSSIHQQGIERIMIIIIGLTLTLLLPFLSPLKSTLLTLAALAVTLGINYYAWQSEYSVIPLAATLLLISLLFIFNMSYGYFVETRRTRRITQAFGQYVAPERVQELSDNPNEVSMEGESREMTVLFSDVRGFTRLSEGLEPKELTRLMNAYLTPMTQVVQKHHGTIDKYIGDALMSFWGAPLPDERHAENAVRTALDMQARLVTLNQEFRTRGWPAIEVGIGINTGSMNVGDMGSAFRLAYTVMGDSVNLASRLEALTKDYGVPIIVGEATRKAIPEMLFRELDVVRVKGKQEPVTIYEPLGFAPEVDQAALDLTARFHDALKFYRAQRWDEAESVLQDLVSVMPGAQLFNLYLSRIAHFRMKPPGDKWDAIFSHEAK